MLEVMAGAHPADPSTVPLPLVSHAAATAGRDDLRGLRIAVSADFGFALVEPEVERAFEQAVTTFAELGCELVEAHPTTEDPVPLWMTIAHAEGYASEGPLLAHEDLIEPRSAAHRAPGRSDLVARVPRRPGPPKGALPPLGGVPGGLRLHALTRPAALALPGRTGRPVRPRRRPDPTDRWWGMDAIANLTGQPVTAVPWDLIGSGLPFGVQLMGRRFADAQVLAAAGIWEAHGRRLRTHPA